MAACAREIRSERLRARNGRSFALACARTLRAFRARLHPHLLPARRTASTRADQLSACRVRLHKGPPGHGRQTRAARQPSALFCSARPW